MVPKHSAFTMLAMIACVSILVIPVFSGNAAAQSGSGVVTGSSHFSIVITGLPNTPYYVWFTRTSSMTGAPGDQPPVIVGGQGNVEQDPPDGPYIIGSYQFYGGGGLTIRDDVAQPAPGYPNTAYYAKVTTDDSGRAVVEYATSSNTAKQRFSIKVENPQNPNLSPSIVLQGTTPRTPTITATATPVILPPKMPAATPLPTTIATTPATPTSTSTPTSSPTGTPTKRAPLETGFVIAAVGAGLLVLGKR